MFNRKWTKWLIGAALLFSVENALAISLQEAAKRVARQYNAKVLSAHTVERGNTRVHVVKVLTKDGVVKVVRVPDNPRRG